MGFAARNEVYVNQNMFEEFYGTLNDGSLIPKLNSCAQENECLIPARVSRDAVVDLGRFRLARHMVD